MGGFIVYQVPGIERVHEQKNIFYKEVAGQSLTLDLYTPAEMDQGTGYPVVLLIYGEPVSPYPAQRLADVV